MKYDLILYAAAHRKISRTFTKFSSKETQSFKFNLYKPILKISVLTTLIETNLHQNNKRNQFIKSRKEIKHVLLIEHKPCQTILISVNANFSSTFPIHTTLSFLHSIRGNQFHPCLVFVFEPYNNFVTYIDGSVLIHQELMEHQVTVIQNIHELEAYIPVYLCCLVMTFFSYRNGRILACWFLY